MPAIRCLDLGFGITTIDTEYVRHGLAASHLVVRDGRAAFIDTGNPHAAERLLAVLGERGIRFEQVDYVMVSHVHLDHAGGAGGLMRALPKARLVVHPRGARHMIDPGRLMAGARDVYGQALYDELYGPVVPIAEERVLRVDDGERLLLGDSELLVLHTPGHAHHHYSVYDEVANGIFTGDTFGMSFREFDTPQGAFIFPSTTPVQFDPASLHASIDRLLSLGASVAYLTHYGRVTDLPRLAKDLHTDIDCFVRIAEHNRDAGLRRKERIVTELRSYLHERVRVHGCGLPDRQIDDLLALDVDLNAQGLDVWLSRSGGEGRGG